MAVVTLTEVGPQLLCIEVLCGVLVFGFFLIFCRYKSFSQMTESGFFLLLSCF